jgi:hypothetical protein
VAQGDGWGGGGVREKELWEKSEEMGGGAGGVVRARR